MPNPLVSILLPVKNGERFLAEALESAIGQDYAPFEILVIDDHSSDESIAIARGFSDVRCFSTEEPGMGQAYNVGLRAAHGDVLAFLSHDDLWLPGRLREHVGYMQANPSLDYSFCRSKAFLEPGDALPPGSRRDDIGKETFRMIMEALLVRSSAVGRIGFFNEEINTSQDSEWLIRAKDAGLKMGVLEKALVRRRLHSSNSTYQASRAAAENKNLLRMLRRSIHGQAGIPDGTGESSR